MVEINKLTQSIGTGNYYFVKRGKILKKGQYVASNKVDVTKTVRAFIIESLVRYLKKTDCIFCGEPATSSQKIEIKGSDVTFSIMLCNHCEVK